MTMELHILGSSSSGNCAVLKTAQCRVLIDAGLSGRRIQSMLGSISLTLDDIDAVFITHEHSDHVAGLRGLAARTDLKFFANSDTARAVQRKLLKPLEWHTFATGSTFSFCDLEVTSFSLPHDAADPVGFLFTSGEDTLFSPRRTLAWCTDLGYVPRGVADAVRNADCLVIESNYDTQLLEQDTRRPWSVKQRISGRHGHLSNQAAFDFLSSVERPRWNEIFLGHLSRDCNELSLVERLFAPLIGRPGGPGIRVLPTEGSVVSTSLM